MKGVPFARSNSLAAGLGAALVSAKSSTGGIWSNDGRALCTAKSQNLKNACPTKLRVHTACRNRARDDGVMVCDTGPW